MNKRCVELLKEVINNNYHNIRLDNMSYNDDEFYYEFKSDNRISENDFNGNVFTILIYSSNK